MNLSIEEAFRIYLIESRERLQQMEGGLLPLEQNASDEKRINSIFPAVHTIKHSAGMPALDEIVTFTQHVEPVLDLLHNNKFQIGDRLVDALPASTDQIDRLVNLAESTMCPSPARSAVKLREKFSIGPRHRRRANRVVVAPGAHRAGSVVDSLLSESQTAIQPFGRVIESDVASVGRRAAAVARSL